MKTSEKLRAIARDLSVARVAAVALEADLPPGRTRDVAELTLLDAGRAMRRLLEEADVLEKGGE